MEDHGLALGNGKPDQSGREQDGLLVPNCLFARGRLLGGQPGAQAGRRRFQIDFERPHSCDITLLPPLSADGVGQVSGENRPKPRPTLGIVSATKLVPFLVSLQQGLLYEVRGIDPVIRRSAELHPSQEPQVIAVLFKTRSIGEVAWLHRESQAIMVRTVLRGFPNPGATSKHRGEVGQFTGAPEWALAPPISIANGFRDKNLSLGEDLNEGPRTWKRRRVTYRRAEIEPESGSNCWKSAMLYDIPDVEQR